MYVCACGCMCVYVCVCVHVCVRACGCICVYVLCVYAQEAPAKKVHDAHSPFFADPLKQPTNYIAKHHNNVINN